MTVCRYYLQGTCRFGNRCRFEHIDPDSRDSYNNSSNYSNRRNDYGYQDRYRTQENYQDRYRSQENYQDRSNKYENQDLSFGPRRYNNYETSNQNFKTEKYNQYDTHDSYSGNFSHMNDKNFYKEKYGTHSSNQRYSSPERQSSNSRYDSNYQKSQFKPTDYSNKYDKNQYEWVSDEYRKQHQKKDQLQQETSRYQTPESNRDFSFKNSYGDKDEDIDEENMILAERVKEDVTSWELGNQWPFTCYSPFPKKREFPGFRDISFEELRYEALKAKENNSFDYFVENIAKAVIDVQSRRNKLKQPTENVLSIIQKLRAGEDLNETSETKDGFSVMNFTQGVSEDIADEVPLNTQSAMSTSFSFKDAPVKSSSSFSFKDSPVKSSSSFSFKAILDQNAQGQSTSSSSFSFKVPQTNKLPAGLLSSTDGDFPMYTPLEQLSEQDKEQFSASTFTLGKIPTVPPPKVFCF